MADNEENESVNWVRGPKIADLSKVPVSKLIDAHEQRGVEVDLPTGGESEATIIKTAVTGMPSPKTVQEK